MNSTFRYNVRTNYKHFTKQIKPHDSILKHKEFLINSFTEMFMSSINFDPEFLLRKLQIAYSIQTISEEYRSLNITGLKITYSFDSDIYTNHFNNKTIKSNVLTIYQHSAPATDEDFENLISKLVRYCKELTPISDTKIMIARKLTSAKATPKSSKELLDKIDKKDKKKKK